MKKLRDIVEFVRPLGQHLVHVDVSHEDHPTKFRKRVRVHARLASRAEAIAKEHCRRAGYRVHGVHYVKPLTDAKEPVKTDAPAEDEAE